MTHVKRLVLDVLKPHAPTALELSQALAELGHDYRVKITTVEMDEQTQTLLIEIQGSSLDFDLIQETISVMGGSLHSIDEVEVIAAPDVS